MSTGFVTGPLLFAIDMENQWAYHGHMKNVHETFLATVDIYMERTGISGRALGINAAGDTAFMTRLRQGRSPSLKTADRVLDWMRANPPRRKR